jgi:hypothetical protein
MIDPIVIDVNYVRVTGFLPQDMKNLGDGSIIPFWSEDT